MNTRATVLGSLTIGLVAAGWVPSDAVAQDALGAGNVLDRNLSKTDGPVNVRVPGENFSARNLLVTGNVAGGRGFRGSVGYRAPGDFSGDLGSDELDAFLADSALSRYDIVSSRQTVNAIRWGQELGIIEYRRSGSATTLGTLADQRWSLESPVDARLRIDAVGRSSLTTDLYAPESEPAIVGRVLDDSDKPHLATLSSMRGVRVTDASMQSIVGGWSMLDTLRVRAEGADRPDSFRPGDPFIPRYSELALLPPDRVDAPAPGRTPDTTSPDLQNDTRLSSEPDLARILERVAARYADRPDADVRVDRSLLDQLDTSFLALRTRLEASASTSRPSTTMGPDGGAGTGPGIDPGIDPGTDPGTGEAGGPAPVDPSAPGTPSIEVPRTVMPDDRTLPLEQFGLALRHGERIETFSHGGGTRFDELMHAGEESLRDGDYFRAERSFSRALGIIPNHPLAFVGSAHAQLGAGYDTSASLTLRRLFARYPELIDVRYGPNVLPRPLR
ncbi:MAG: hypothetical protein KDA25_10085, partial [Phycisphaerales bacterium]|nr:hypothetical protein [Phycisphaerales bacterium]